MKPRHKTALLLAFMSAAGVSTTLLVWRVLTPNAPPRAQVPFDDFIADAHAGRVMDVHIDGDVYRFTVRRDATSVTEQTTGPRPDIPQIRALMRPANPDVRAPRIYFER